MRNPRFLHIGLSYYEGVDIRVVDKAVESDAWDWVRYSRPCYIVWTTSDAETVVRKILRVPGMANVSVMVWGLDMSDGFGNLPLFVWDWLKKDRGYGVLQTWAPLPEQWVLPGLLPPPKP